MVFSPGALQLLQNCVVVHLQLQIQSHTPVPTVRRNKRSKASERGFDSTGRKKGKEAELAIAATDGGQIGAGANFT